METDRAEMTFDIRARSRLQGGEVLHALAALPGVKEIHWL
jgi:hypothetical protein